MTRPTAWPPWAILVATALLALAATAAFRAVPVAHGHALTPPHRHLTLTERATFQRRVLRHDRYVLAFFARHRRLQYAAAPSTRKVAWHEVRFHRAQRSWTTRELGETNRQLRLRQSPYRLSPLEAIMAVFGSRANEAIRVADCETGGTFSPAATNGQYHGLFQMGAHERATYGDSSTAYGQAVAAHRYFVATGSDWSPWQCRP